MIQLNFSFFICFFVIDPQILLLRFQTCTRCQHIFSKISIKTINQALQILLSEISKT